jgi:hypothetical protein
VSRYLRWTVTRVPESLLQRLRVGRPQKDSPGVKRHRQQRCRRHRSKKSGFQQDRDVALARKVRGRVRPALPALAQRVPDRVIVCRRAYANDIGDLLAVVGIPCAVEAENQPFQCLHGKPPLQPNLTRFRAYRNKIQLLMLRGETFFGGQRARDSDRSIWMTGLRRSKAQLYVRTD